MKTGCKSPVICPPPGRPTSIKGDDPFAPVLALVALGHDRFERAGHSLKHLPGLALSVRLGGIRLRRGHPVRPGAPEPVVDRRWGLARQRSGRWDLFGTAPCQPFHWSG